MNPRTAQRLEGIGEYYFSQKLAQIAAMNKNGAEVINLGIGSPDLPPHPDVISVLANEATKPGAHGYQGYRGSEALRRSIAAFYEKWYGVLLDPVHEILPLIGSKEGIMHLCMTYLGKGDKVLIPDPGYPTYRSAAALAGATCIAYSLKAEHHWQPDFEALERMNLSGVKMMWVNYPHMPTGALAGPGMFEQLVAFANRNHILICHDNPYSFILNSHPQSILSVKGAMDVAVELNSLSKSHNMAGWRVGMLCGNAERINEVLRFKSNMDSGMFLPLQLAAARALQLDRDWFDELNSVYASRREKAGALLDLLHCERSGEQVGLFLWARVPEPYEDAFVLSDAILEEARVFLTPGGIFGEEGKPYLRLSLCSSEEKLDAAIQRIKQMKK